MLSAAPSAAPETTAASQEPVSKKPLSWQGQHRRSGLVRGLWVGAARLGVPVLAAWLGFAAVQATGAFADPTPTATASTSTEQTRSRPSMTFNAGLNLLGLVNNVAVSPSTLRVNAGDTVDFRNNSSVPLTLAVADQTVQLPSGHTKAFQFPGSAQQETLTASATPVDVPVVGNLIASSGTVTVAPAKAAQAPVPAPSGRLQHGTTPGNSTGSADSPTSADAKTAQVEGSTQQNSARGVGDGGAAVLVPVSEEDGRDATTSRRPGDVGGDERAGVGGSAAYRSASGVSEEMGLLMVVAMILLIGVGVAATRAVFQRPRVRQIA